MCVPVVRIYVEHKWRLLWFNQFKKRITLYYLHLPVVIDTPFRNKVVIQMNYSAAIPCERQHTLNSTVYVTSPVL